jgi:hypothetical protein
VALPRELKDITDEREYVRTIICHSGALITRHSWPWRSELKIATGNIATTNTTIILTEWGITHQVNVREAKRGRRATITVCSYGALVKLLEALRWPEVPIGKTKIDGQIHGVLRHIQRRQSYTRSF